MKKAFFVPFFLLFLSASAQDFSVGYDLLESGDFAEAFEYFKKQKNIHFDNFTVNICYGRAMGLSGKSDSAVRFFEAMRTDHPDSKEVLMNYAEALLWAKDYTHAAREYERLSILYPKEPPVLVHYAQALSALGAHENARIYIDSAVFGLNDSASIISLKYIYLAHVQQMRDNGQLDVAIECLSDLNVKIGEDKDVLLNLGHTYLQNKQSKLAKKIFDQTKLKETEPRLAYQGLALAHYQTGQYEKALKNVLKALSLDPQFADSNLVSELYLALHDPQSARQYIDSSNQNQQIIYAKWLIYMGQYESAQKVIEAAEKSPEKSTTHFISSLAIRDKVGAKIALDSMYIRYGESENLEYLKAKQITQFSSRIHTIVERSLDSDDGESWTSKTAAEIAQSSKSFIIPQFRYRLTRSLKDLTSAEVMQAGIQYKHFNNKDFSYELGLGMTLNANNPSWLFNALLTWKIHPNQEVKISMAKTQQDFNTALLQKSLFTTGVSADHHISWHDRIGLFTQASFAVWNDGNRHNSLYNSLYYKLKKNPNIKIGVNLQFMHFSEQKPLVYFSPNAFILREVFCELHRDVLVFKNFFYHGLVSYGLQNIEKDAVQRTYRFEAGIGYKIYKENSLSMTAMKSNAASNNIGGFGYQSFGLNAIWYL